MFAIVSIAGFQERVRVGSLLRVPSLSSEKGTTVTFKDVFLLSKDGGEVVLGKPLVLGASIEATVVDHGRDDKIRIFKMRRRKRYMRTKGHRQGFTRIQITKITG